MIRQSFELYLGPEVSKNHKTKPAAKPKSEEPQEAVKEAVPTEAVSVPETKAVEEPARDPEAQAPVKAAPKTQVKRKRKRKRRTPLAEPNPKKYITKPVIAYDLNGVEQMRFNGVHEAARAVGRSACCLTSALKKRCRTAAGFVWEYGENVDGKG